MLSKFSRGPTSKVCNHVEIMRSTSSQSQIHLNAEKLAVSLSPLNRITDTILSSQLNGVQDVTSSLDKDNNVQTFS